MIFKEAMRSLRFDKVRAFFYCLTLTLTTAFISLYFNIAMDESVGLSLGQSSSNIITIVTLISVCICCIDIFFANDYFVKNKSKDLAIRLISGATYVHIAGYLLIQTCLLLLIAIPAGYAIARAVMPAVNSYLLKMLSGGHTVSFVRDGVIYTNVIIGFIVCWIVVLNLSFTYVNSASNLINQRNAVKGTSGSGFYLSSVPLWLRQVFWLFLFIMPLFSFYQNCDTITLFSCLGMLGLNGVLRWIITPLFTKMIFHGKPDPVRMAVLGFLREDLKAMKTSVYLLLVSVILMVSILVTQEAQSLQAVTITISYVFLSALQALALMFRYATELASRQKHFASLSHIGYDDRQISRIANLEILMFYGSVILIALLYLVNIFASLVRAGRMDIPEAYVLVIFFLVPLLVMAPISLVYYRRTVIVKKEKTEDEETA